MPLDPDIEAFLDIVNGQAHGRLRMSQMTVAQAREAYDRSTLALDTEGTELPVESFQLPSRDGAFLQVRLYRGVPEGQRAGTLLFFHGGGYVLGGLDSHDSLCRDLACSTPCNVLAVDYRLAPEHRFPTAFLDAQDAFAWLRSHGQQRGLYPDMLAVGGDSVGGSLAAAMCIAERQEGRTQPLLQLLIYPCTASHQDSGSHQRLGYGHLLESDTLQWMFSQYLREEADRQDWRFAPLQTTDLRGLAPAHLVLAEYDPLFDEGQMYAARMRNARVPVDERVCAGQIHDFVRLGNVTPQAQAVRLALSTVLAAAFERATADTEYMNTTQPSASYT